MRAPTTTCPNCGAKRLKMTDLKDCVDCGRTGCVKCYEDDYCDECDDKHADEVLATVGRGSKETVNHPAHYTAGRFEVIDVIEDWRLGFCLGNAVKYIARADHKGSAVEDLKKAAWYLNREIERRQKLIAGGSH